MDLLAFTLGVLGLSPTISLSLNQLSRWSQITFFLKSYIGKNFYFESLIGSSNTVKWKKVIIFAFQKII